MDIRNATAADLPAIEAIFSAIHTAEESGLVTIGWKRGIYPTAATAELALNRGDLFVQEDDGKIVGTGIINQQQVDVYRGANWRYAASDQEVMVLHTLVISPGAARKGYGRSFVAFYENYAKSHGCNYLRIDTNEKNANARALYSKLGYAEAGIVPCVFNGLDGIHLVLLEKRLS
ncbi:GNAT family N-acetyltransferase [Oscillibacter sp.]|uniref:GNAT family N-acetyltransferase n=1 Tax=Oscillibacter sp. TaxID=1945593 RepID=UPI00260C1FB3|nr:GNAT family N-acetyltransferase [Oscillibacter sp.]MDD3346810.1 GNAT family N-acetyltransferase [Oscillibacter sp.]